MGNSASAAEDMPFDAKDFPKDLLAAQLKLAELYTALRDHQARLPWSRDADDGWPDAPERWHRRGRPKTTGWEAADAEMYDRLWKDLRTAAAAVQGHDHWSRCKQHGVAGADLVATRQALKNADGAVPAPKEDAPALDQEDVERAA
ncbi:hypothetical protein [Streptomyces sviceus]|uniref:hypothetical protein n=1 Tax=Streptomyces sviceus TaxID=285530 RepID=UPI003324F83D